MGEYFLDVERCYAIGEDFGGLTEKQKINLARMTARTIRYRRAEAKRILSTGASKYFSEAWEEAILFSGN